MTNDQRMWMGSWGECHDVQNHGPAPKPSIAWGFHTIHKSSKDVQKLPGKSRESHFSLRRSLLQTWRNPFCARETCCYQEVPSELPGMKRYQQKMALPVPEPLVKQLGCLVNTIMDHYFAANSNNAWAMLGRNPRD